jgi:hypothetical protein
MTNEQQIYIHRMEVLAGALETFLDTHDPEQFDISIYHRERECGSVVCTCGLAGEIPEFQEQGLVTLPGNSVEYKFAKKMYENDSEYVGEFLGLRGSADYGEICDLFYVWFYLDEYGEEVEVTPAMVAKKLRGIIESRKEEWKDDQTS